MSELHVEPVAGWTTTAVVTVIQPYAHTRKAKEGWYWVRLRKEECRKLAYDLLRVAEDLAEVENPG